MKSQRYQPVNEWNSCHKGMVPLGDVDWKNVVPDTGGIGEASTPGDVALAWVKKADYRNGINFKMKATNWQDIRS